MSRDAPVATPRRRYCTQRELDEMCRNAVEIIHEAIDSGDAVRAHDVVLKVQTARNALADLFPNWSAATLAFVYDTYGEAAMAEAMKIDRWLALGLSSRLSLDEAQLAGAIFVDADIAASEVARLVSLARTSEAKQYWDRVEAASSTLHDYRIDWSTEILSHVHRAYGNDGVAAALAHAAAQPWWSERMPGDLVKDPVTRVTEWSFFLGIGNFGTVSVAEEDDCFIIHHQVCGSCAKQELRGRHEAPWSFARIAEPIPTLNFGIANYTVYRAHLAAWHYVMPTDKGMAPWPAIECSGVPGRCWFTIYKDPLATPENYFGKIGRTKQEVLNGERNES